MGLLGGRGCSKRLRPELLFPCSRGACVCSSLVFTGVSSDVASRYSVRVSGITLSATFVRRTTIRRSFRLVLRCEGCRRKGIWRWNGLGHEVMLVEIHSLCTVRNETSLRDSRQDCLLDRDKGSKSHGKKHALYLTFDISLRWEPVGLNAFGFRIRSSEHW